MILFVLNCELMRESIMQHTLKLNIEPYNMIFSKRKILEGRLNDEKRQQIKVGDTIVFQKRPDLQESFC